MEGDRTRNILIGIVVIIIITLLAVFIVRRRQNPNLISVNSPLPTPFSSYEQQLQNNFNITVPQGALKASLKDVTGGNQIGLITLDKTNNQSTYTVIANLDDPITGSYRAWLVKDNDYFSLGKLSIAKAGYLVNFTTPRDLKDYKIVWVTLDGEALVNTPGKHILEGSF